MLNFFLCVLLFINDDWSDTFAETAKELERKLEQLKVANQKLQRNSRGSVFHGVHDDHNDDATSTRHSNSGDSDQLIHIRAQTTNSSSKFHAFQIASIFSIVFTFGLLTQHRYWKLPGPFKLVTMCFIQEEEERKKKK